MLEAGYAVDRFRQIKPRCFNLRMDAVLFLSGSAALRGFSGQRHHGLTFPPTNFVFTNALIRIFRFFRFLGLDTLLPYWLAPSPKFPDPRISRLPLRFPLRS